MTGTIQPAAVVTSAEGPLTLAARGLAKTLCMVILGYVLAFAVFEGVPNPFLVTWQENLANGAFLAMFAGLYIGLLYERAGGMLAIAGLAAFAAAHYPVSGSLWPGHGFALVLAAAVLLLFGRRKQPHRRGV